MSNLDKRVSELERQNGADDGCWHTILMDQDQSHADAFAAYRHMHPGKAISREDNVMWIQLVSPELDANGSVIPSNAKPSSEGPSIADLLDDDTETIPILVCPTPFPTSHKKDAGRNRSLA